MGTARSRPFPDCAQEPPAFWPLWRPLVGPVGSPPHARSPGRRRRRRPVGRVCCPGSFQPPTSSWEAGETIRWHEAQMSTSCPVLWLHSQIPPTLKRYHFICFLSSAGGLSGAGGSASPWRGVGGSHTDPGAPVAGGRRRGPPHPGSLQGCPSVLTTRWLASLGPPGP